MKWRLGLDLGTNSIGWAALKIDSGSPTDLLDMGVRIFSNGRKNAAENRVGAPLNESRRIARQMRRQRDRRIRRKKAMLNYLTSIDYFPGDKVQRKKIAALDPYELRNVALSRPLSGQELGRILMQFVAHRGFKSNRKENLDNPLSDTEQKAMSQGISQLKKELGDKTLGQWLWERKKKGERVRFRPNREKSGVSYQFYPSREMYEEEFNRIREFQEPYHHTINWERLHWLIFFQRPLKRPERGHCQFYQDEFRAYSAEPSAQRFRILQDLNDLKYYDPELGWLDIPDEIKPALFKLFDSQKSVSFNSIRQQFGEEFSFHFNLENEKRDALKGNETSCEMRKPSCFGSKWDKFTWEEQDRIVEFLIEEEDTEKIAQFLSKYQLDEAQINKLLGFNFPTRVTMLSARFMRDCNEIMLRDFVRYDVAVTKLGLHHSAAKQDQCSRYLPYYGKVLPSYAMPIRKGQNASIDELKFGRIPNPTVHIALNQTRKVVNALIRRFGHPEEVIVEVGRELKLSDKAKAEVFSRQAKNQDRNAQIEKMIRDEYGIVNAHDFTKKYKLWEELAPNGMARCCPYCGKPISATQLFSPDVEIEHILPYSKTLLDSYDNLTVAHRSCNQIKGDRSPYEAFGTNPPGFDWASIQELAKNLPLKKQYKFSPTALNQYINNGPGFLASQATDNAYISKLVKDYLATICNKNRIWVTTGSLTYLLRGEWGMNTLLNRNHDTWFKNRSDHRHHALDALVIGLCDRGIVSKAAKINAGHDFGSLIVPECPIPRTVIDAKLRELTVSLKPNHRKEGKLFAETALSQRATAEKIAVCDLKNSDVDSIIPIRINTYVKTLIEDVGYSNAIKKLADTYKYFMVVRKRWVTTAPLTELSRRDLENICDLSLREKVLACVEGLNDKADIKEALQRFSQQNRVYSVRYAPKDQVPHRIESCENKAYMPYDCYRVDIWRIPNNKKKADFSYKGSFVSRVEAIESTASNRPLVKKRHPAAKMIMSLYKGDVIELSKSNFRVLCRVASYSTTNNKIDIQPLECAEDIALWCKNTKNDLVNPYWLDASKGQNQKSINSLFKTFKVRRVHVSPDGQMRYIT